MRILAATCLVLMSLPALVANERIDMPGYLRVALEAAEYRQSRRISEDEFKRMAGDPGTIVLDARNSEKFRELHIRGAINLSFADIAIETLARTIPDRNTRILIYCNNNFRNAEGPFPAKIPSASLNLSTFIALYNYGYRNVWELAPLIDIERSTLAFQSTAARPSS